MPTPEFTSVPSLSTATRSVGYEVALRAHLGLNEGEPPWSFALKAIADSLRTETGRLRGEASRLSRGLTSTGRRYGLATPADPRRTQRNLSDVRRTLEETEAEHKYFSTALRMAREREAADPALRQRFAESARATIAEQMSSQLGSQVAARMLAPELASRLDPASQARRLRSVAVTGTAREQRITVAIEGTFVLKPVYVPHFVAESELETTLQVIRDHVLYIDWERSEIRDHPRNASGGFWLRLARIAQFLADEVLTTMLLGGALRGIQLVAKAALWLGRVVRPLSAVARRALAASRTRAVSLAEKVMARLRPIRLPKARVIPQRHGLKATGRGSTGQGTGAGRGTTPPPSGRPPPGDRGTQSTADSGATAGKAGAQVARRLTDAEKATIYRFVDDVETAAADLAAVDADFLAALNRGRRGITTAGTRFHTLAKQQAERLAPERLPGYTVRAEFTAAHGKGGSRLDLLIETPRPKGKNTALSEVDWKTSVLSGVRRTSQREMERHAAAVLVRFGKPLSGQESRSWGPAVVRALHRAKGIEALTPKQRAALQPWL